MTRSAELFSEAQRYLPGGVDSPVRAFKAVGGQPPFITAGHAAKLTDADDNEYIDYVCSWGALILGHAHPDIVATLRQVIEQGTSFGAPTERETTLAKLITSAMPSVEMIRFVNSGTEATMSALRLARAFTARDMIVKFAGCYHGHSDGLLAKAGSGVATMGLPDSPGVPRGYAQNTLIAPYNDLKAVERLFDTYGKNIAAIIVEPVAANMGVVAPKPGFLRGLREITSCNDALLIFDEVITGFRVSYGGAQSLYGLKPDLTCLGKIIGGGLPVGAYGGRREIMGMVAPSGPVYQAGTLSGNPLTMAAGIETLRILSKPGTYDQLEERAKTLEEGMAHSARRSKVPVFTSRVGSCLTLFFANQEVIDYDSALSSNKQRYARFFKHMLESGIYLPPSQFEAAFVSLAHSENDVEFTLQAADQAFARLSTQDNKD